MQENQVKSKERVTDHGEVFTAKREVNAMLDLVKAETERIDARFLEPACGTGNFLVEILERKLNVVQKKYRNYQPEFEKYAILAITSIYGIDLLQDNVIHARERLFDLFQQKYTKLYKKKIKETCFKTIKIILEKNIICGNALTLMTENNSENNNNQPIIFSEWAFIGNYIKRRDFTFQKLLNNTPMTTPNLFSDMGEKAFIPTPIQEFPKVHFLKHFSKYFSN